MKRFARLICACAAVLLLTHRPVQAQDVVGHAGPFAMPISNRSLERFGAALKLDADQKALARSLYAGYRSSFRQAVETGDAALRAQNDQAREADGHVDYTKMAKDRIRITREFVDKAAKLEKTFLDDLKAVLTPEQAAGFDRAERTRRREVGLKFSFIAGEAVDVFQILHDLKIDRDTSPGLKEELDQYEVEVDKAMIAKDKMLRGVFDQMEKFEGPEPDPALIEKTLGEFFSSGMRLRDVHRQFVRRLEPSLPADKQAAFGHAVKKASFPRVYGESAVDKTFAAAREIADLSPDQKTELQAIVDGYTREVDAANTRWATAIEDKQAKLSGNFMAMMGGMGEEAADDPLKVAREARKALDERTMTKVTQLLKAEQREKMPQIEKDEGWHGEEFMPDFDEHGDWEEWKKEDEPKADQPKAEQLPHKRDK
jgi:hypothetical protein